MNSEWVLSFSNLSLPNYSRDTSRLFLLDTCEVLKNLYSECILFSDSATFIGDSCYVGIVRYLQTPGYMVL